jgi:cytochrome c551/c552
MPATEATWRDLKLMHVVFGVSSLVMLVTTIWMLADDHNREWKAYQRQFQEIETWTAQARIDEQQSEDFRRKRLELESQLEAARSEPLKLTLVEDFRAEARKVDADQPELEEVEAELADYQSSADSGGGHLAERDELLAAMRELIARRRFREDNLTREVKGVRAELDKARADYDIAVGNARPADEIAELKATFDRILVRLEGGPEEEQTAARASSSEGLAEAPLVIRLQEAKLHRLELERLYNEATARENAVQKELAEHMQQLQQLHAALVERAPNFRRDILTMPVLDAFGSPLKIDQIWLPQLTLNNNFRDVARFDRCTTCHQAMDKTQPGSATLPGYQQERQVVLELPSPTKEQADEILDAIEARQQQDEEEGLIKTQHEKQNERMAQLYGFRIAERGLLEEDDAAVNVVLPETRAALAGLMSADVLEFVGDAKIVSQADAFRYLVDRTEWKPLSLTVRRGLPHPFSSHPRLDLFVGSTSPHPMGRFGCTICHQGQGSSTSFEWASHMPNNLETADAWSRKHGWFNNHHWIFPMYPARFAESSCLKCHHQVDELAASPKYPEGPAPQLMKGYQLILDYGCYGCHEINGFDGPTKRIGPDLRNEPNFFAAAAQLLVDPGLKELGDDAVSLAQDVVDSPANEAARRRLQELVAADVKRAADLASQSIKDPEQAKELPEPKLSAQSHKMEALLRDVDAPGVLRRVGPSLRHVATKNSFAFLYDWIEDPHRFRPSTKMPRFFGLHDHLDGEGVAVAQEFEPIEVRAISEYLLAASQPFEFLDPGDGVEGSAERGKKVFQVRGCLACHSHAEFPDGKATHGPDLSRIGAKLATNENGKQWLYSWVRQPNRYHSRTVMPDTFLDSYDDAEGNSIDPALDVTEYLMTSQEEWQPRDINRELTSEQLASLEKLALLNLEDKFPTSRAVEFLKSGIPASQAGEIKGDETALIGMTAENRIPTITQYVGRRAISKYGCFGCHDIPGFEDAKPIGTGLADWGRKDPSRLAFENIMQYLHNGHGGHAPDPHGDHEHAASAGEAAGNGSLGTSATNTAEYARQPPFGAIEPEPLPTEIEAEHEFFIEKMASHEREGFIWQKLQEPRSYDYKKTENKKYNERLRMPKFYFSQKRHENDEAIEAIMTFVLGLVSEPPVSQYVYRAPPEQQAIVSGRKLLEKFNCGGCHVLELDRWDIEYRPGWAAQDADPAERKDQFTEPIPEFNDYEFLRPHFTPQEREASLATDRRNHLHATIVGAPLRDHADGSLKRFDDEGIPLEADDSTPGNYEFVLYEPALINGVLWPVGGANLRIQPSMLADQQAGSAEKKVRPARGGDLARLLFSAVVADNSTYNTDAKGQEAWGWLPPPLPGEGHKVQTGWLHDFLLDPYAIRPAAVLRMPKFNMSSHEAETLANYFAAVDGATYPYAFDARTRSSYLAVMDDQHPGRLGDALKIVTDNNYCVKCHLVGDYSAGGDPKALAPQLERVHERLRPDYLHGWIANPKRFLPYTGMPVNIPHTMPVDQKLYEGTSEQQLSGVVDLLMNFDRFTQQQFSVKPLIKAPPPQPAAGGNSASAPPQNNAQ